jgi:uncharacterized spore protein YtfJ
VAGAWHWFWVSSAAVLVVALVTGVVLVFAKWQVGFSLVLRAEVTGAWAFVAGFSLIGLALTFVAAEGVAPHLVLFVLGKRWKSFTISELHLFAKQHQERRRRRRKASPAVEADPRPWHRRGGETLDAIEKWVDPFEGLLSLFEERRRLRLAWMNIDATFGAEDPTITGQVTALFYVLDTFLPARVRLLATPDWEPRNRLALSVEGRVFAWPGRLMLDFVGFACRALWRRARYAVGVLPRVPLAAPSDPGTEPTPLFSFDCIELMGDHMANDISNIVTTLLDGIHGIAQSETIVGEPQQAGDAMVIPVHRLRVAFGVGGAKADASANQSGGGTGGMAAGGSVQLDPVAAITVSADGTPRILTVDADAAGAWSQIVADVPDILARLVGTVGRKAVKEASHQAEALLEDARNRRKSAEKDKEADKTSSDGQDGEGDATEDDDAK